VVAIVSTAVLLGTAHSSAVVVSEEQPSKLAMMEGMYDSEVPPLYAFGWVDEQSQEVVTPFSIPGGTSFLATGTWDTEFPGLNELAQTEQFAGLDPATAPVNFVFQTYHLMVAMFGAICLICLLALIFTFRKGKIVKMRWLQWLCVISPVFPFIAIQAGWFTAEVGRQPWVVYPSMTSPDGVSLLVQDGVSASVSNVEVAITLILFLAVYLFLLIAWARTIGRFIKEGPAVKGAPEAGAVAVEEVLVVDEGAAAAPVADASRKGGE